MQLSKQLVLARLDVDLLLSQMKSDRWLQEQAQRLMRYQVLLQEVWK
ncbi:hypothetical protein [Vibrio cholerae]|nr:hypothetical protein [Vibrio cholerae]CPR24591.1 hypothetical protein [Vibrio cholerae]CPR24592.1 hypothetical protein [Vibrio cholerae]